MTALAKKTWVAFVVCLACGGDDVPHQTSHVDSAGAAPALPSTHSRCTQLPPDDASEETLLGCASDKVRRSGDTLTIAIPGQSDVVFVDNHEDGEGVRTHLFKGGLAGGKYWLVRVEMYESASTVVVDATSGRQFSMIAAPILSPSGSYLAAAARDLGTAEGSTGLEIWRADGDSLMRVFSISPYDSDTSKSWGPGPPAWRGDDTLVVPRYRPGDTDGSERLSDTIRFVRRGAAWVMKQPE